ncbi:hypothetical protein HMPREF1337_02165 [Enterococcus faecalis ERV65]|nr:hypothetical protein HMPREF0348_0188 [Enterococcus faecalis TX0104]EJU87180.1 hypothetical protein HMPREF1329_01764 [Enterococcus faecalis ERV116]EJU89281.1 hypothetical protein HMPREF1328_01433 [Enterococcus faecalis ERV103]EJU94534.1 hypothetical protein HMPREF1331_02948 [Enterococcus faecalis ERV25]EJV16586.1 hypothetical protein HMPREF1337_02165 [Enterococcus faecalis ERV65]EJV36251.1 hypothetical protein HMPREF1343_02361 [Enterococcus faecalis ERV93]EPH68961.1 hypothetical protein D93
MKIVVLSPFMERMNIPQKSRQQRLVILPQRPNPPSQLTEALHLSFLLAYMGRDKEDYQRQVPPIKDHLFIWESALSL